MTGLWRKLPLDRLREEETYHSLSSLVAVVHSLRIHPPDNQNIRQSIHASIPKGCILSSRRRTCRFGVSHLYIRQKESNHIE